ncbi:MAG: glycosyl transferase family 36, partial [Peptococcaceae bacterium]|nr:glycosyl transferase family 36 [Peptococcaceae bacterium]
QANENWLPPDNVQLEPDKGVASRTSPTNIGLALLANIAARDLGYISLAQMYERITGAMDTLEKLERWKGHFFNWYDTRSLKPLLPLYISTVDSGNLVCYLITLRTGLQDILHQPVLDTNFPTGLKCTCDLLREELEQEPGAELLAFERELQELRQTSEVSIKVRYAFLRRWSEVFTDLESNATIWAGKLITMLQALRQEMEIFLPWLAANAGESELATKLHLPRPNFSLIELRDCYQQALSAELSSSEQGWARQALAKTNELVELTQSLQQRVYALVINTDFRPLYDKRLQLFSIGYRVEDQALDKSFYDLLASEARQASYIAIAKGDVPESHWFRLGRVLTKVNEQRSLLAWSGTMFEFLMPLLVMRAYPGTLLDETYRSVCTVQRRYGIKRKIPWGISESGYFTFDAQMNYQYKAFGVPGLGLKRGLVEDLVVAPYATYLTLQVCPHAAMENLQAMFRMGFGGRYGLYEAIDFTSERIPKGKKAGMVQSFMAHHQGMSFLALTNVLQDNSMQRRFHADSIVKAAELLLQERVPEQAKIKPQPEEKELGSIVKPVKGLEGAKSISITNQDTTIPITHFLSNGHYSVMLTNSGSGYSRYDSLDVSRWREDTTRDAWGMYFYIQNLNSATVWSATGQLCGSRPEDYKVTYAPDRVEYCRRDGNIATKTEIVVSAEDPVEIRRISLTNHGNHDRTLEVTSYFEVVLARHSEDLAHPAFANLFVQTEYTGKALLAVRRPRSHAQSPVWLLHTLTVEGEEVGTIQYETDRARFIGRGRSLAKPQALEPNQPLSNTAGTVLDPIMSLRPRVRIHPGHTAHIAFVIGVADSRDEAVRLAEKYKDAAAVTRALELAWTYSEMELRHLNLTARKANEALGLGGNLLYLSPCRRELAQTLRLNRLGQSSLWPYAISGDIPIVLVRIQSAEQLDFVRQILTMHEYWRRKGLQVDLVILNEDVSGYFQSLQESLHGLVASGHAREFINRSGGIFILQHSLLSKEESILLQTVARMTFSGQGGSCAVQVRQKGKLNLQAALPGGVATVKPEDASGDPASAASKQHNNKALLYHNGYGGFSEDGLEYIIELKEGVNTPLPWINVIANQTFGCLVAESGSGYTWSDNSRENKLSPWSNDPILDPPGEALYLQDQSDGAFWNPTPAPVREKGSYTVRHGRGYTVFEHISHNLSQQLTLFVPTDLTVKVVSLEVRNIGNVQRSLQATYYAEPVMGVAREQTAPYLVTEFDPVSGAMLCTNTYQEEFAGRYIFLAGFGGRVVAYTGDRTDFIGRNGNLAEPQGLCQRQLSNAEGAGFDPCLALQLAFTLEPGEAKQVYFLFGEGKDLASAQQILAWGGVRENITTALRAVKSFWQDLLGTLQVSTPDQAMDLMLNGWLLYQTTVCRLWARSAFYQSGGAIGFRDQLQDVMALSACAPELTRQQILLHCNHQFTDGDVQHWWHAERSKGIRTKFSDDLLWLPFVTADYLQVTEDYALLDEQAGFLRDEPLGPDEQERYSVPTPGTDSGTVYEHCIRAIEHSLQLGEHGLPLIGSGDWNDGFSRIGVEGKGESIWLGWFLHMTLVRFATLCERRGDTERAERYRVFAANLLEKLEMHGWDGSWYRRAYFDDGSPLGSASNEECQIDTIAQAWAVFAGSSNPRRIKYAMESLEHYLLHKDSGILLLLTPPFDKSRLDPGYIKGYVPGVRENGGQYTHAATWVILAYAAMGEGCKATELFRMLNPINHARTATEVANYKTEPYVMAADVYATVPHIGRGGWTWYTGAAGWMYQAGIKGILGFNLQGSKLEFKPCIPDYWPGYNLVYRYGSALYKISVLNPDHKMTGITTIEADGESLAGTSLPLQDDGKEHQVNIFM